MIRSAKDPLWVAKAKTGFTKKTTNQHLSDFQVQNLNILQVLLGKYQHPKNKSDFLMGLQNASNFFAMFLANILISNYSQFIRVRFEQEFKHEF